MTKVLHEVTDFFALGAGLTFVALIYAFIDEKFVTSRIRARQEGYDEAVKDLLYRGEYFDHKTGKTVKAELIFEEEFKNAEKNSRNS